MKRWGGLLAVMVISAFLIAATATAEGTTSPSVFINEIHYDNDGVDVGEAIEIAGPAYTNLAGWSLVLYDGAGGTVYATIGLSGVLTNQQNGYGTKHFEHPGIQDGPDGLALVDPTGTVVQFISYEFFPLSILATDGPAAGTSSVNINANEPPNTLVGHSLQLVVPAGETSGTTYGDFVWATAQPNTMGSPNDGQVFGDPPPLNTTGLKTAARDLLADQLPTLNPDDDEAIAQAILRIDQSLDPDWWDSASGLDPEDGKKVFNRERQAAVELAKVVDSAAVAEEAALLLVEADRRLAQAALDAAIADGGSAKRIADAQDHLATAETFAAAGDYPKALEHFRKAWQDSIKAL